MKEPSRFWPFLPDFSSFSRFFPDFSSLFPDFFPSFSQFLTIFFLLSKGHSAPLPPILATPLLKPSHLQLFICTMQVTMKHLKYWYYLQINKTFVFKKQLFKAYLLYFPLRPLQIQTLCMNCKPNLWDKYPCITFTQLTSFSKTNSKLFFTKCHLDSKYSTLLESSQVSVKFPKQTNLFSGPLQSYP